MLYEFRWDLPGDGHPSELVLRIHSITGWLGPKRLSLNDQPIYRRGIFSGINHRFGAIPGRPRLRLKADKSNTDGFWRPTLFADGAVVPEKQQTTPPANPRRPKSLGVTIGLTYLTIFILFIMWFPIEKMLNAAKSPTDSRVLVVAVQNGDSGSPSADQAPLLPTAMVGRPYQAQLSRAEDDATAWRRKSGMLPSGLMLDAKTGVISGMPEESGDFLMGIEVSRSTSPSKTVPFVLRVEPAQPTEPHIVTAHLPVAAVGKPYTATLIAEGGKPPYEWICNSRKLPDGLSLKQKDHAESDSQEAAIWQITGTPEPLKSDDGAAVFPIRIRVNDSSYFARNDTRPWFIPIIATVVCLLGFWSMIRASVLVFGAVIVLELLASIFNWAPISLSAVAIQLLILTVGIAHFKVMR